MVRVPAPVLVPVRLGVFVKLELGDTDGLGEHCSLAAYSAIAGKPAASDSQPTPPSKLTNAARGVANPGDGGTPPPPLAAMSCQLTSSVA